LEISMLDIFRGFVRNYHGLRLEYFDGELTYTKYTNVILNYFLRLGEHIGLDGELEKNKCDLMWARPGTDTPLMHLEHENEPDLQTVLDEEFVDLRESKAPLVIGLFYPNSKDAVTEWIDALREASNWRKEVLFILNPLIYGDDRVIELHGLLSEGTELKHYRAIVPYLDEPVESLVG